jgi:predicted exporter
VRRVGIDERNGDRTQLQFSGMTETPASSPRTRPTALTDAPRWRGWRALAWLWLVVVLAVGVHQWKFWHESRLESDVLALLPQTPMTRPWPTPPGASPMPAPATWSSCSAPPMRRRRRAAAQAYRASLSTAQAARSLPFAESTSVEGWFDATREFYLPWRDRLLTDPQRSRLRDTAPDALAEEALAALYGPMASPRMTQWREDPLNLWPQWWQAQAAASGMRFDADGLLQADDSAGHARTWAVLQFETRGSAFRLDGERVIDAALDDAYAAASKAVPDLRELRAGVPLHAEAAAVQASREVNIIGFGSLAAVLLLVWLAFRSLTPIVLVALSLLIGVAAALSVTAMVFGQVHLLTLVFGASLVGVAEDYGIHWFASRQGHPGIERWTLLRSLLPGMALAWLTSALAYLALGLAPFPGCSRWRCSPPSAWAQRSSPCCAGSRGWTAGKCVLRRCRGPCRRGCRAGRACARPRAGGSRPRLQRSSSPVACGNCAATTTCATCSHRRRR